MSDKPARYIIYLLHAEGADLRSRHYIGSTTDDHFKRRLRAHSQAYGARLTARLVTRGATLHVARIWETDDRRLERQLKRRGHAKLLCPICRGEPELRNAADTQAHIKPLFPHVTWRPTDF